MPRLAGLQVIGPAIVFAALLAAEAAAYGLALQPSSPTLWSLNLGLFGIFRNSRHILGGYCDIACLQLVCIGLPLAATACGGLILKRRFGLALASSLGFVYVLFLLHAWYVCEQSWRQAFLVSHVRVGPEVWLAGVLVSASLLSLIVSHMSYWRACKAEGDGARFLLFRGRFDRHRSRFALRGSQ
jgi:hypothetical protein